jgi:hypothetical protein
MGGRKEAFNKLLPFHAYSTSQKVKRFYSCEISKNKFLKILFLWELFALISKLLTFSKGLRGIVRMK